METSKHKDERGGTWQVLYLSKYECDVLANQQEGLRDMADGRSNGICIGGANIEIELKED